MAFQPQQRLFAPQPASIARELTTGTQNAVARHDDTDRIASNGRPHRTHRLGLVQLSGQIAIALAVPGIDLEQRLPHRLLKGGAA
jgi:hypothetical protein